MKYLEYPNKEQIKEIITRPTFDLEQIVERVKPIITEVKNRGDEALRKFALEFDNILLNDFKVDLNEVSSEISEAKTKLSHNRFGKSNGDFLETAFLECSNLSSLSFSRVSSNVKSFNQFTSRIN